MDLDTIYFKKTKVEDFSFNESVSLVFDDMVNRSVPLYKEFQNLIVQYIVKHLVKNTNIYDLGCATGTTLILLNNLLNKTNTKFYGIDNSESMLFKANEKVKEMAKSPQTIHFIQKDLTTINSFIDPGCFILNLTLQFIRPMEREDLLKKLYNSLPQNGFVILYEKLLEEDSLFTRNYIDLYYDYKQQKNYSKLEISRKREELENVLIPFTEIENKNLLRKVGFSKVSTISKYLNFGVIIAIKL
ncbi:carboxy-S-adenosyl-L-methionine synthase CmoA [Cytobacillus sp. FSL K6-0265]|uniref:carboxy-S-adenosyl-L-methionine synthase CmoA n=1 Tax=Cytobacillus sp. FSL K6-0265 TaxID=2921448 RepID=UPI0030FA50A6